MGDSDPLLAIEDALRTFPADEIVLASDGGDNWLMRGLCRRSRERFDVPVREVAVGKERREPVAA